MSISRKYEKKATIQTIMIVILSCSSVKDTLPCQIPRVIWFLLVTAPPLTYQWMQEYLEERQLRKQQEAEEQ